MDMLTALLNMFGMFIGYYLFVFSIFAVVLLCIMFFTLKQFVKTNKEYEEMRNTNRLKRRKRF